MSILVGIEDIRKTFKTGSVQEEILKGIDLDLHEGEVTALVGSSGSGKSTFLTIAAGLQYASDGRVLFEGNDMNKMSPEQIRSIRATRFGFVFQFAHLVPFLAVEEQLLLMLEVSGSHLSKRERKMEVANMLKLTGMEHRKHAYPSSLSGGEKQRTAIARALIHKPKVLFADEPTASLDSKRSREVMALIRDMTKNLNIATLLVTHDEEMLAFTDRVIKMADGRLVK